MNNNLKKLIIFTIFPLSRSPAARAHNTDSRVMNKFAYLKINVYFIKYNILVVFQVVLFQTTGNLFLYIIGDLLSYRTILWICLSLPTFHMVFVFMPDSPPYLVKKGRIEVSLGFNLFYRYN